MTSVPYTMSARPALCLLLCLASIPRPIVPARNDLKVVYKWINLDFKYDNDADRRNDINKGFFTNSSVPIDVSVNHRKGLSSRLFVGIPRFTSGIPITFGVIGSQGVIEPYPSYEWHKNQCNNCEGFTSVFRSAIDECNRLWVLDTGRVNAKWCCSPQVVAFNLDTDQVVFRHRIGPENRKELTLLITPVVDVGRSCDDVFVYLADVEGYGMVVVDVKNKRDYRIQHKLFYPFPNRGSFFIQGAGFDLMDGIFGMALSPRKNGVNSRTLFFHALASTTENQVSTAVLQNSSLFTPDAPPMSINVFSYERDSQSGAEAIDKNGIMYFGLMEPPRLACWNTATEFRPENIHIIAQDNENLQFIGSIKLVDNLSGSQELWLLASAFQKVMTNTLSTTSPNFRVSAAYVDDLLRGTRCKNTIGFQG